MWVWNVDWDFKDMFGSTSRGTAFPVIFTLAKMEMEMESHQGYSCHLARNKGDVIAC